VVRGGGLVRAPATSHDGGAFPTPTRSGQRTWLQATSRRVAAAGLEPTRTGVSAWVDSSAHLARPSALLLWNCDGTSVGFGGKLSSLWWRCFQHLPTLTLPCLSSEGRLFLVLESCNHVGSFTKHCFHALDYTLSLSLSSFFFTCHISFTQS